MAELSDAQLRDELKALMGADVGPVTGSTRAIMVKKLESLRATRAAAEKVSGGASSRPYGLSSDDSEPEDKLARKARKSSRAPAASAAAAAAAPPPAAPTAAAAPTATAPTQTSTAERRPGPLSDDDIRNKIKELTGENVVVTSSTRDIFLKKIASGARTAPPPPGTIATGDSRTSSLRAAATAPPPREAAAASASKGRPAAAPAAAARPSRTASGGGTLATAASQPGRPPTRFDADRAPSSRFSTEESEVTAAAAMELSDVDEDPVPTVNRSVNTSSFLDVSATSYEARDFGGRAGALSPETPREQPTGSSNVLLSSFAAPRQSTPAVQPVVTQRRSDYKSYTLSSVGSGPLPLPRTDTPARAGSTAEQQAASLRTPTSFSSSYVSISRAQPYISEVSARDALRRFRADTSSTPLPSSSKVDVKRNPTVPPSSGLGAHVGKICQSGLLRLQHLTKLLKQYYIYVLVVLAAMAVSWWLAQDVPLKSIDALQLGTFVCKKGLRNSTVRPVDICNSDEDMSRLLNIAELVRKELSAASGRVECNEADVSNRRISADYAKFLGLRGMQELSLDWQTVLRLFLWNPEWGVSVYDGDGKPLPSEGDLPVDADVSALKLECLHATKSASCICRHAMIYMLCIPAACGLGIFLVQKANNSILHFMKSKKDEEQEMYELIEQIIDVVKSHFEHAEAENSGQPYLAISHVRDMLLTPPERIAKQKLWDKAVAYINTNETRMRQEVQPIHGEDFVVWRWIQDVPKSGKEKVWQGHVLGDARAGNSSPTTRLPFSPTPCLKIRNMFEAEMEYGEKWPLRIQDAILEKCGATHSIVHIAVDRNSVEGCVFLKCATPAAAEEAYKKLHGWWFGGKLITVKFLRLERYHERFPDARYSTSFLKPSNDLGLSLGK